MENDRLRAALNDSDPENYFRANGSFTLLSDGQRTFIRNSCTLDTLKNAIHIATHRFDAGNLYQLEGTAWEKQGPALQECGSIGIKKEVFDNYPTVRKWSNCFLIYTSLVAGVLGAEIPGVAFSLISFHNRIIDTADKYKWKEAVLPLALHFHKHRLSHGYSNFTAAAWDLPIVYLWHFCYGNELYRDGREFVDHSDCATNGAVYKCKSICQAGESDNGK
ncbi:hypothetical protein B0O99DRAFT_596698 [Bisporella sp. PMI_857]|nr:hypothetical protein B0O99DRAFT_596698 [Bisporella sp. PMI_857]